MYGFGGGNPNYRPADASSYDYLGQSSGSQIHLPHPQIPSQQSQHFRNSQPQSIQNLYQQHQQQLQQQQHQQQQQHFQQQQQFQHHPNSAQNFYQGNFNYSVNSPYSFSSMQSPPPSVGSPAQHFANPNALHSSQALSPSRNITSPTGYPHGSPLSTMRQHSYSGSNQGPMIQGSSSNSLTSPPPVSPSSLAFQQSSSLSQHNMSTALNQGSRSITTHFDHPVHPTFQSRAPTLNGPSLQQSQPPRPSELPTSPDVEEPLPQYPSPEELEKIAATTRPMIPEPILNRIFAKAGVTFADPKIGNLIALASQNLINDIIKEAAVVNKEMSKGNEKLFTRVALEKVLQDRGMKQLPPDPFAFPR